MSGTSLPAGAITGSVTQYEGPDITIIKCTTQLFQSEELTILNFTEIICEENDSLASTLGRKAVNELFEMEVRRVYQFGHPMIETLLGQITCPLSTAFWDLRNEPDAYYARNSNHQHTEFRFGRQPTAEELKRDKGVVIMDNDKIEIKVPRVGLLPLSRIDYTTVAKDVREANDETIPDFLVCKVWRGIIRNLYHNVCECSIALKLKEGDPAVIHPPSLRPAVATKTTARTRTTSNDPRPEKRRRAMGDGSQPGLAAETLSRKNLRKDRKLKKKYPMVKGGDTYCLPGERQPMPAVRDTINKQPAKTYSNPRDQTAGLVPAESATSRAAEGKGI
ncbi:hypothetical protein MMC28_008536 [Mycoblastus sanguinarius]|nr:hypothetical protein [Mycoblastus sanguinarius]